MEDNSRRDIRRILKTFGIEADEAMVAHLARQPDVPAIRVRITLEDLTDYGDRPPAQPLAVTVEDTVRR